MSKDNNWKEFDAPKINCFAKYGFGLTITFGGEFVHVPVAKYIGGFSYVFKGMTGAHAGEEELKKLASQYGLTGIRGFYHLDGGFVMVRTLQQYVKLYNRAILYGGLNLYADCSGQLSDIPSSPINEDIDEEGSDEEKSDTDIPEVWVDVDVEKDKKDNGGKGLDISVEFHGDVNEDVSDGNEDVVLGGKGKQAMGDESKGKKKTCKAKHQKTKEVEKTKAKAKGKAKVVDEDEFIDPEYDFTTEREEGAKAFGVGSGSGESDESDYECEDENVGSLKKSVGGSSSRRVVGSSSDEELGEGDISLDPDSRGVSGANLKRGDDVESTIFSDLDLFCPEFSIGTMFTSKKVLKLAIASHAQVTQRKLTLTASDPRRAHYKCKGTPPCGWKLHVKRLQGEDSYTVIRYYPKHACNPTSNFTNCNSTWLAKKYISTWACDPKRNVSGMRKEIKQKLGINVTRQQLYRDRKKALIELYGTEEEQIGDLWDYRAEVLDKNPGSTMLIDLLPGTNIFDKLFCCLAACKEGFKHCRPLIGFDGCHLSGEFGGVLLTAVGIDPNNNTFSIAWAVVKNETFDNWSWFLSCLETDLGLQDHKQWTFISDKQKGLRKAFDQNFSESSNRFCVKHLHGNMKTAGFTGSAIKECLWFIATATIEAQFAAKKQELEEVIPEVAERLFEKEASEYSRAFFSTLHVCDTIFKQWMRDI